MALTVAELRSLFTADTRDIDRAQDHIRKDTRQTQSVLKTATGTMAGFLGANLATSAVRGIGRIVASSTELEQKYSKTMSIMRASTGATASEMDRLDALAMKMGADTQFSAGDAADAMLELAKAGVSTSDIMGGGLQNTLLLAAAGGTDLATAATIASNAMNTFGIKGSQTAKVAAALAGGANASSASIESLGQGLQQVGPGARNAGLSLQETVAVLSAFDSAGIKGSDAGTSLKTMLVSLVPQTKQAKDAMKELGLEFVNADGSFKSISQVADQLQKKLGPLSEAQRTTALSTIFGSDAARAASVLMNEGAKGLGKYITATKDQAAAQKMADAAMSGTSGAMEKLRGSVETAELAIGKALAPAIEDTANFLSEDAVPAVTDFIEGMQDGTGAGGDFADILGDVVDVGQMALQMFEAIPGPVKKYGAELLIAYKAMSLLGGATSGMVGAVTPSLASMKQFRAELSYNETRMGAVSRAGQALGGTLRNIAGAGGMIAVADSANRTSKEMGALEGAAGGAMSGAALGAFGGPWGAAIGGVLGGVAGGMYGLSQSTDGAAESAAAARGVWSNYASTLDDATGATTDLTKKTILMDLQNNKILETTRAVGITDSEVVAGMLKGGKAREDLIARIHLAQERLNDQAGDTTAQKAALAMALANLGVVEKGIDEKKREIQTLTDYKKVLKGLPSELITTVELHDVQPTIGELRALATEFGLSRAEAEKLLKGATRNKTAEQIQTILDKWFAAGRLKPVKLPPVNTDSVKTAQHAVDALIAAMGGLPHLTKGGGGKGGGKGGGTSSGGGDDDLLGLISGSGRVAAGALGTGRSTLAGFKTEGSRLDILEQRRTVRDLMRDLNERKKLKGGKRGGYVLSGLDRQIAQAQLAEARKELERLMGKAVNQEAIDAAASIAEQLKQTQGLFTTGTTSAAQGLKNLLTDQVTNNQWMSLLAALKAGGAGQALLDEFKKNGPSSQALALGNSILSSGLIGQYNNALGTLGNQQNQIGAASTSGNYQAPAPMVNIEQFNAAGQSPDEIASRLYFQAQVQG